MRSRRMFSNFNRSSQRASHSHTFEEYAATAKVFVSPAWDAWVGDREDLDLEDAGGPEAEILLVVEGWY